MVAGLASFGLGEATYKFIPPERVMLNTMGTIAPAVTGATQLVANARNAALAFGLLGACLAGCLGIAGGLARRSRFGILAAGLLGATIGAALPASVSLISIKYLPYAQFHYPDYELIISMLMHGSIWGLAGAAAGMAFAVGLGQPRLLIRSTLAGLAGAIFGAIVFDLIGGILFPLAETGEAISTNWPSRLTARVLVCIATAALVVLSLPTPRPSGAQGQSSPTSAGETNPTTS